MSRAHLALAALTLAAAACGSTAATSPGGPYGGATIGVEVLGTSNEMSLQLSPRFENTPSENNVLAVLPLVVSFTWIVNV